MTLMSRVWDKKKKEMIYDFFIDCDGTVFKRQADYFVLHPDNIEVMYYTQRYDKNGKEICQGDIIISPTGKREEVLFRFGAFGIGKGDNFQFIGYFARLCEVVGNVFENPELLKKEVK